ncbi:ATP-binding protein [Sphingomonas sp. Sphisp140]|uniref:sensor histidine kinase NtrY-like n=1 Tax=unclassified Sphingomonas TaxID=196159 RepID=UPI0039AFCE18
MDAVTAEPLTETLPPRRRLALTATAEIAVVAVAIVVLVASYFVLSGERATDRMTPTLLALLLIANLVPAVAVMMLVARRFARRRAAKMLAEGGGQLHVRLVGIFSLLASVPIVLTVIAASIMFQTGGQFWISDRAKHAFDASMELVRNAQGKIIDRWVKESDTMASDISREAGNLRPGTQGFHEFFWQNTYYRNLNQAALFSYTKDSGVNIYDYWQIPEDTLPQAERILPPPDKLLKEIFSVRVTPKLAEDISGGGKPYVGNAGNTLWIVRPVKGLKDTYLYVGSAVDAAFLNRQVVEAQSIITEYNGLQKSAQSLQLRFNVALFGVALLIMAVTAWVALAVADRLVRPLNLLVAAARRAAEGDLSARVPEPEGRDEVATLSNAFNGMTERLQAQTNALVTANAQAESRRVLIEAVMSGVSAGVISIDAQRKVRLINESAIELLHQGEQELVGHPLVELAPELNELLDTGDREAVIQLGTGGDARTLAVKVTSDEAGKVLTFDDITQQLNDQRRAAWSDVARRIAHEIKNPLTPIQLAAERLKRRYGKKIEPEDGTFAQLTDTIVRQVGDLRRMVDEFSSFARMPKPMFRQESLLDIARQAMFLHEVAHPTVRFEMDAPDPAPGLICDRRQIGQAFTNIVKNAVEAIEARGEGEALPQGEIVMTIHSEAEGKLTLTLADNGIGLPVERDRIVEPYMTTRSRGTGLGLAIVKKIVEEHFGTIGFSDRPGGGTLVTICFDTDQLAGMASAPEGEGGDEPRPAVLTRTGSAKS